MTAAATHIAVWALGVFTGATLTIFALAAASTARRDRHNADMAEAALRADEWERIEAWANRHHTNEGD